MSLGGDNWTLALVRAASERRANCCNKRRAGNGIRPADLGATPTETSEGVRDAR